MKMKLNRTIVQWRGCDPKAMVKMSEQAIMFALSDAREDILALDSALSYAKTRHEPASEIKSVYQMTIEFMIALHKEHPNAVGDIEILDQGDRYKIICSGNGKATLSGCMLKATADQFLLIQKTLSE